MKFGLFTGSKFVRGIYGGDETEHLLAIIKPGDVMYDIGAHVGYYTLLAEQVCSRHGAKGFVYAFEPLPLNLNYLRRHVQANQLKNAEVLPFAVGLKSGQMTFDLSHGTGRGHLSHGIFRRSPTVNVTAIDELVAQGKLRPPNVIKMDIEGAEYDALCGAAKTIKKHRPLVSMSIHSPALEISCSDFFRALGYTVKKMEHMDFMAIPN